ncbi:fumarylacetoacetate hydrolase family protein [Shouchella shacheensis]|uniref:fumarylacetoacetate hydrolase family protein n=1 Tax=Shouchella shacheensis TaxID=1649580 RepID=UPI00074042BF|nr:fumarylacetoacetate hydrolase family protein [Shouchella shacheensis]
MKFIRFRSKETIYQGVLTEEEIRGIEGDLFSNWSYTGKTFSIKDVTLLAPLEPNQVIGIGANFIATEADRPAEVPTMPVFFFKATSSVIGPEADIVIPSGVEQVKFESELAVVIGKTAKNIAEEDVFDYVFGYTVGNDVTCPDYFHENGHWTLGKSFDTFTPLGPLIETDVDPLNVSVKATLNGEEKQNSHVQLMIVSTQRMISYLSHVMTLTPGDVILTGSPVGAEMIQTNDDIACTIDEIGTLQNRFVSASK